MDTPQNNHLPTADVLQRLAISESGFVFDPATGHSFTLNDTGLDILRFLQTQTDMNALVHYIGVHYQVDPKQLERDLADFLNQLRRETESGETS